MKGPWDEGLDARVWVVGEVAKVGGVVILNGKSIGEETVGVIIVGGDVGDGIVRDWIGDSLGVPSRETNKEFPGFQISALKILTCQTIHTSDGWNRWDTKWLSSIKCRKRVIYSLEEVGQLEEEGTNQPQTNYRMTY